MSRLEFLIAFCLLVACGPLIAQEQQAELDDGIRWGSGRDGLVAGVRLSPADGKLKLDQPLELHFVIKNTGTEDKTVVCTMPVSRFNFELRDENLCWIAGWTSASGGTREITIAAGQTYDSLEDRTKVQVTGLAEGRYNVPIITGIYIRDPANRNSSRNLGGVANVAFRIGEENRIPEAVPLPENQHSIVWGEPMSGIRLGAQLVRSDEKEGLVEKSGRFHLGESMHIRLHLFNGNAREVAIEVAQPRSGENWNLAVLKKDAGEVILKHPRDDGRDYLPKIYFKLAAGQDAVLTETEVTEVTSRGPLLETDGFVTTKLHNAELRILSPEDKSLVDGAPIFPATLGNYFVSAQTTVYFRGSDFRAILTSGQIPFRVVANPLEPRDSK